MNEELLEFYREQGLDEVKKDIKKRKEFAKYPMEMDLLCRIELCLKSLEYENGQLNYMVEKQLDYHWNRITKK